MRFGSKGNELLFFNILLRGDNLLQDSREYLTLPINNEDVYIIGAVVPSFDWWTCATGCLCKKIY